MSLNSNLPDFKLRVLAALQTGQTVILPNNSRAYFAPLADSARPYTVQDFRVIPARTTRHESAALAVAFLASL